MFARLKCWRNLKKMEKILEGFVYTPMSEDATYCEIGLKLDGMQTLLKVQTLIGDLFSFNKKVSKKDLNTFNEYCDSIWEKYGPIS